MLTKMSKKKMIFLDKLKLPVIIFPVQQLLVKGWLGQLGCLFCLFVCLCVSRRAMKNALAFLYLRQCTFNKKTDVNRPNKVLIKMMEMLKNPVYDEGGGGVYPSQTFLAQWSYNDNEKYSTQVGNRHILPKSND